MTWPIQVSYLNSYMLLMTLITNLNNEDTRNESLNYELTFFHNWLKANKLSLNINKTKAMVFHMPQKRIQLPLLKIAGADIEFVDNFTYVPPAQK